MKDVIGFFGGDGQTGTTMIAWSFAEVLSGKGNRVLLIFGSGSDDQTFLPAERGRSIDALKAAVRSGRVERDDLLQSLEKRKELWILPGIRNPLTAGQFLENTFEILLTSVEEDFDYVVIDGGSDVRMGLTVSALSICTRRYFVVTQEAKTLQRYLKCRNLFFSPLGFDGKLILNQYRKDPALFLKGDVTRLLETSVDVVIPYVDGGWLTEMEQRNLLHVSSFGRAVEELIKDYVPEGKKEGVWRKHFT